MGKSVQESFVDGYTFTQKSFGSLEGSFKAHNYVSEINKAIASAQEELNTVVYRHNTSPSQAGGFVAEVWHKGTYNIDSKLKEINTNAWIPERNGSISKQFAQADVATSNGDLYGAKYDGSIYKTAIEQAKSYWEKYNQNYHGTNKTFEEFLLERGLNPETTNKYASIYEGQFRLVPADQLKGVADALKRKILEKDYRGEDISGLKETLNHITDRIKSPDGVESIPLSKEDSKQLAMLARDGKLDLDKFGINTENLVNYEYIFNQAINAGITASVVSMVLKITPEIYKSINKLIKDGEINIKGLENIGLAAISGSGHGFINGSISAAITTACLAGTFGNAFKTINPTVIGTLTVLVTNTISYSIKLASKKISSQEFSRMVSKDIFISTCSIGLGTLTQTLLPELPAFAFLVGSFIGSLAGSFAYEQGYSKFMSFCCNSGFTCFGLVEQDYKIPDEILKNMNIKIFDFRTFDLKSFDLRSFNFNSFEFNSFKYETIGLRFMNRDVIGIFKIGYSIK